MDGGLVFGQHLLLPHGRSRALRQGRAPPLGFPLLVAVVVGDRRAVKTRSRNWPAVWLHPRKCFPGPTSRNRLQRLAVLGKIDGPPAACASCRPGLRPSRTSRTPLPDRLQATRPCAVRSSPPGQAGRQHRVWPTRTRPGAFRDLGRAQSRRRNENGNAQPAAPSAAIEYSTRARFRRARKSARPTCIDQPTRRKNCRARPGCRDSPVCTNAIAGHRLGQGLRSDSGNRDRRHLRRPRMNGVIQTSLIVARIDLGCAEHRAVEGQR